jgi:hypothetical protein
MKLPTLRRDPTAALEKARADLIAAESALAGLRGKREAALVESDDLELVQLADGQITETRRTIAILNNRVAALRASHHRVSFSSERSGAPSYLPLIERSPSDTTQRYKNVI